MKLPLRKTKKECFLALDIGTEAVKALVFERLLDTAQGKYSILGSALEYFDELKPFDRDKVITKAKEEAVIAAGRVPGSLLLGLPANILRSRVDFQVVSRKNPKKIIDKEEEAHLRQSIFKETEKKVAERFAAASGILPQDIHFINLEILEIKIDGYEIPCTFGYSGKNLEFRILATFLPKDYFTNSLMIAADLGFKTQKIINPIKIFPEIMKVSDGTFLDIGGDVTQICLVKNNKIDLINEFGRGGKDFTRAISETLGMRYQEAKTLKERHSRGELTEGARKRIEEMLISACREWSLAFRAKLKAAKGSVPSDFFLLGGGSLLPEIKELIGDKAKAVKLIYPQDFENVFDAAHCANSPQFINSILLFYAL